MKKGSESGREVGGCCADVNAAGGGVVLSAGGVAGDWDREARSGVVRVDGSVVGACCVGGGGGGFVTCVFRCVRDEISFVCLFRSFRFVSFRSFLVGGWETYMERIL